MSKAVSTAERSALEAQIRAALGTVLEHFDALVIPTMGVASMEAGADYDNQPLLVDGEPLEHFCDAALTPMLNIASSCPVLAVPSGIAVAECNPGDGPAHVPTGVQVIARPLDDHTAFSVAAAIEAALRWREQSAVENLDSNC